MKARIRPMVEKAVAFRFKADDKVNVCCLYQNTLFPRVKDDDDIVYLDFKDEEQINSFIKMLETLKKPLSKTEEGLKEDNEGNSES